MKKSTKDRISEIIKETSSGLASDGLSSQIIQQSGEKMKALMGEETDNWEPILRGFLRLEDLFIAYAQRDEDVEEMKRQHDELQHEIEQKYGDDDLYSKANAIVYRLRDALQIGGSADELVDTAINELLALDLDILAKEDPFMPGNCLSRIYALQAANPWWHRAEIESNSSNNMFAVVQQLGRDFKQNGFNWVKTLQATRDLIKIEEDFESSIGCLLTIYGMALMCRREAALALEPIGLTLTAFLLGKWAEENSNGRSPAVLANQFHCDAILLYLKDTLERKSFENSGMSVAGTQIDKLPAKSDEDHSLLSETRLKVIDIAMSYAPQEYANGLLMVKSLIQQAEELDVNNLPELSEQEMRNRCDEILQEVKNNIAAGEPGFVACIRAILSINTLGFQIPDDESGIRQFKILANTLLKEVIPMLKSGLPRGREANFLEAMGFLSLFSELTDRLGQENELDMELLPIRIQEHQSRMMQVARAMPFSNEPSFVREFLDLMLHFLERFSDPLLHIEEGTQDEAESKRLYKRAEDAVELIRTASTVEEVIQPQRSLLRLIAIELNQFERRRHMMIISPSFPTNPMNVDANSIFFSGSTINFDLVKKAAEKIGMNMSQRRGIENKAHARWQMLRGCGIALFDYSEYDAEQANPNEPIVRSLDTEVKILTAAGAIADVAYENGLAYVLGMPLVIIIRKGQSIPFDIDIDPVVLEGDEFDVERLIAGIQVAIYGVHRGTGGSCLMETVKYAQSRYCNTQINTLLESIHELSDPTEIRRTLKTCMAKIKGDNTLLVIPAFPGCYPIEGHRTLFHISAFRPWSLATQHEVELACERAKIDYKIGYKRLNPNILQTIWRDLCQASFVVADITNLNPNAVLELGISHGIGRPTLILTQNMQPHLYMSAIQKLRIHKYDTDAGLKHLSILLDDFLAGRE